MMQTKFLILEDYKRTGKLSGADLEKLETAAAALRNGALVAFPTETVYGLGGNALLPDASRRIYAAKGRPSDNPLIVHISSMEELEPLVKGIPESCRKLAEAYWPGPMTLILNKSNLVPKETTGGLDTVAVRMPAHPAARQLIRLAGIPVAAPSANRSGRPSTTTAAHCREDLEGRVDIIVDGGPCDIGVESTIVDLTGPEPTLLRPGAVTMEMLKAVLGKEPEKDKAVVRSLSEGERPKAPGMKYRHYAPKAPLVIVRAKNTASPSYTEDIRSCDMEDQENTEETAAGTAADSAGKNATEKDKAAVCGQEMIPSEAGGTPRTSGQERNKAEDRKRVCAKILALTEAFRQEGLMVEILCSEECALALRKKQEEPRYAWLERVRLRVLGKQDDADAIAKQLFAQLRATDEDEPDRLIAEGFGENELFFAIMNRLKKAAGWQIEEV